MVRAISFIAYAIFLLLLSSFVASRQYAKCELFEELTDKYQLDGEEAAKWTCIGGSVANYNTSYYLGDLEFGLLGLFGIQAVFWCASEWDGQVCGVTCDKFIDDDITDDLRCAREFILKDYGGSFDTWYKYRQERCEVNWFDIMDECRGNKSDESFDATTKSTSTTMQRTEKIETSVRTVELEDHVASTSTEPVPTVSSTATSDTSVTSTTIREAFTTAATGSSATSEITTTTEVSQTTESSTMFNETSTAAESVTTVGILKTNESSTTSEVPTTIEPFTIAEILKAILNLTTNETPATTESFTTVENTTASAAMTITVSKDTKNATFISSAISELRSVIDNPCKYMQLLRSLHNLTKEETTTWTCITLNVLNCYKNRDDSQSCFVKCNETLGEHCPELVTIVDGLAKELSKEVGSNIKDFQVTDCQDHFGPFIDNWCQISLNATVEERFDKEQVEAVSYLFNNTKTNDTANTLPVHKYKDEDFRPFSSEEVDDFNRTDLASIESTTTKAVLSTEMNETNSESSTTLASLNPELTTLQPEITTRGTLDLNYASILEDPCGAIYTIAQNYNMNKAEASIWLCILRDLTFCHYNCGVDCNTAKRYGLSTTTYCEELSHTIESVFSAVKDALTPLFSLIPFNNCQAEIYPFAAGLCPQLGLLRD